MNNNNNINNILNNSCQTIVDNNHVSRGNITIPYENQELGLSDNSTKIFESNEIGFINSSIEEKSEYNFNSIIDAPIKPSFIDYVGDHFDYNGTVEKFKEIISEVATICGADLNYNEKTFEYEVLAYPYDCKILYAIQIYQEPKRNCYVIEFRRLNGLGFEYLKHIKYLWKELNKRDVGPGIKGEIISIPPLIIEDYKIEAKTISPMLIMITSKLYDVNHIGLTMLLSATKNDKTKDALNELNAMTIVINVGLASENIEIDRLVIGILREGIETHHKEIIKNGGVELIMKKLQSSLNIDVNEILEMQRNCMLFLINLCKYDNGTYINLLIDKKVFLLVEKFKEKKCKRLNNLVNDIFNFGLTI